MTKQRTPNQESAVTSDAAQLLLLAGPGSGKTTTLLDRIRHRVSNGQDPKRIALISFTNAAADEAARRLAEGTFEAEGMKLDGDGNMTADSLSATAGCKLGFVGTLHAFALRMLQRFGSGIGYNGRLTMIGEDDAKALLASIARELNCKASIDELWELKGEGKPEGRLTTREQLTVAEYYHRLKQQNTVDFDLILTEFLALLEGPAGAEVGALFDELYVDEYQDSGPVDFRIYESIRIPRKFYVGDPDQSIYGFRGADVNGIISKSRDPKVTVIPLEENFRSRSEICAFAQRLIEVNVMRAQKVTRSAIGPGGSVVIVRQFPNEGAELGELIRMLKAARHADPASMTPEWHDMAVLVRTNGIAHTMREALKRAGIPVAERRKTKPQGFPLIIQLANLLIDPENNLQAYQWIRARSGADAADQIRRQSAAAGKSINAVATLFPRGLLALDMPRIIEGLSMPAEASMFVAEKLREMRADASTSMSDLALRLMTRDGEEDDGQAFAVNVLTMHAAKGREFHTVFCPAFEEETIPGVRRETNYPEERRIAFVAFTRAKCKLIITHSAERTMPWGGIRATKPSRFIREASGNNV